MRKKASEQLLRASQLERELSITHQRIGQLVKAKKLRKRSDGFFNLADPVNAKYIASRKPVAASNILRRTVLPAGTPPAGPIAHPPVPEISRSEIERQKSLAQLEKIRLQNAKAAGRLVERPFVFAFASQLVSILNSEFLSLGQRLSGDLVAIARKASDDDSAVVAIDAFLQPELYAIVQHVTSITRKFVRELYDEKTGEPAGPVRVAASLEELRDTIDAVIVEVQKREAA